MKISKRKKGSSYAADADVFRERKERYRLKKEDWWKYALSLFLIALYLFPFYVLLNVALKPFTDASSRLIPPHPVYLGNFKALMESCKIFMGMKNSLIITVLVLAVHIAVGCPAAYALSRHQSKFNEFIRNMIMGVMMITPLTILVGVYSTMSKIHGTSTYWGIVLVLSSFSLPLTIFLYTNFIASIPRDLDEAAAIDGASNFQTFFIIIFPQLKAVTTTVVIIQGVAAWNEYTYSYYFLQKESLKTVTLVIQSFFGTVLNDYGQAAANAAVGMLPMLVLYLFLQKYFIQGQIDAAIKS